MRKRSILTFKLRSDLGKNSDDIESLVIEIINKKAKMLSLVQSIDNNATIIDYINTNNFLNNDMHSRIIKADISDHFPIFLIQMT